jgi:serine protease Do
MHGFGEIAESLRRSTVQVFTEAGRGAGSGVVWNSAGLILTNAHVARAASQAEILLWDGRRVPAQVTARDPRRDLAALRISADDVNPAALGDSSALRPGELVIAVGSPFGFAGAVSTGVVHSVGALAGMGRQDWIRADVQLAPGNSGGPLANAQGQVIGINTAIVNGLGVAVPANAVAAFVKHGPPPRLGVTLRPSRMGLQVLEVEDGGPAANASLRPGDVLLGSYDDLGEALASGRDVVRVQFLRGNPWRVREAFVKVTAGAAAGAPISIGLN